MVICFKQKILEVIISELNHRKHSVNPYFCLWVKKIIFFAGHTSFRCIFMTYVNPFNRNAAVKVRTLTDWLLSTRYEGLARNESSLISLVSRVVLCPTGGVAP